MDERPLLNKKPSVKIRSQGEYNDCFSYARARFIRKLVTNILIKEKPKLEFIFTEENIEEYFDNLHDYIISIFNCSGTINISLELLINDLNNENDVIWNNSDEQKFFDDKTNCSISDTCNFIAKNSLKNVKIKKNFEKFYYLLPSDIINILGKDEYINILNLYDISVHFLEFFYWDITIIPPPILLNTLDDGYYIIFSSESHATCMTGYQLLEDGTYNFIIKNSWGEDWEQDYSINNDEEESYKNKIIEAIINIKNDRDYEIPYTKFENHYFGPYFMNVYIELKNSNEFEKLGFLNIQPTDDDNDKIQIIKCIKILDNYYRDISKNPNFFKYFYEHLMIHNLSNNISELQKTDNYLEWIDYNNMNLKKYYERNTSFKDPNYNNNRTFILKFNEYLLYIININRFNLRYFYFNLKDLYDIETAKKNEDYKKQFEYTKGIINMNNKYYKKHKNPRIKLSIPVVNKKSEIKTILNTKQDEIKITNKNFEISYKGHYYEKKNYKIFHGNGILIIKENNNILWYCIGIFENGWIKKGLIYCYYEYSIDDTVENYKYYIFIINKDKLLTLKYNLDSETLKYDINYDEYENILGIKTKSQKITDVSIIEKDIQDNINKRPELKELLSFTEFNMPPLSNRQSIWQSIWASYGRRGGMSLTGVAYYTEPFNKGGKRRKTTKRNRYKKRKLRTKKRK